MVNPFSAQLWRETYVAAVRAGSKAPRVLARAAIEDFREQFIPPDPENGNITSRQWVAREKALLDKERGPRDEPPRGYRYD